MTDWDLRDKDDDEADYEVFTHLHVGVCTSMVRSDDSRDVELPSNWSKMSEKAFERWRQKQEDAMMERAEVFSEVGDDVLYVFASTNKVGSTRRREIRLPEHWEEWSKRDQRSWIAEQEGDGSEMIEAYSRLVVRP